PVAVAPVHGDGALVCLEPRLRPMVDAYARTAGGRPVLDAVRAVPAGWTGAVTLVGLPAQLGLPDLRAWSERFPSGLSVLTGRDIDAVTFLLAKQLLARAFDHSGRRRQARLDELHDEAAVARSGRLEPTGPLTRETVEAVVSSPLDLL